MSKDKIKIGRYSKKMLIQNQKKLEEIESYKSSVPYLLNYTDAQDVIITCKNSFSSYIKTDWHHEITAFDQKFHKVQKMIQQGFSNKSEFIDIYKVTGVEIDFRKEFLQFFDEIVKISFKNFICSIRKLPGMKDLPIEEFFSIILTNRDDFHMLQIAWSEESISLYFDETHKLTVGTDAMSLVSDPNVINDYISCGKYLFKVKPTHEEFIFLIALSMMSPTKNGDKFSTCHYRFVLAFTRYLQSIYSDEYHKRLADLMNLISFLKEKSRNTFKWLSNDTEYLHLMDEKPNSDFVFSNTSTSIFSNSVSYEKLMKSFKEMNLY